MENPEKFNKWIKQPLEALLAIEGGNGAFVAIMAIMAVLNGLVKAVYFREIKDNENPDNSLPTDEKIADFLALNSNDVAKWRHAMAAESWQMFMVPKKQLRIGHDYGAIPEMAEDGLWQVDPWKFIALVLSKAADDPDLIEGGYFPLMRAYIEDENDGR